MKKRFLCTVLSLLVVFASVATAGAKQELKNDIRDVKQSKKQVNSSIAAYNNLSLAIDFWHDASLKGDSKAVSEHTQMIQAIISEDIKESHQSVAYAKLEASYSHAEYKNSKNRKDKIDDKFDYSDDKRDLQNETSILNAKKLLLSSLKKSKSFGYSYRLLADYLQLLKKDIDAGKIEIAEDVSELKEDAGKVRFIR